MYDANAGTASDFPGDCERRYKLVDLLRKMREVANRVGPQKVWWARQDVNLEPTENHTSCK